MYGKCRDCGNQFDPAAEILVKRDDVCDACADRRGALIQAVENRQVSMDTFRECQRKMANGRGTAKAAICKALAAPA